MLSWEAHTWLDYAFLFFFLTSGPGKLLGIQQVPNKYSSNQTWHPWHSSLTCSVTQFSCVWLFRPHGLQRARLPCPSLSLGVCSNSCPLSWWCHSTISSSVSPSPPALSLSQHEGPFQWVSSSHQVASGQSQMAQRFVSGEEMESLTSSTRVSTAWAKSYMDCSTDLCWNMERAC